MSAGFSAWLLKSLLRLGVEPGPLIGVLGAGGRADQSGALAAEEQRAR